MVMVVLVMQMLVQLKCWQICVDSSEFSELLMKQLVMQLVLRWLCVVGCSVQIRFWLLICSSCVVRFSIIMLISSVSSEWVDSFSGSYDSSNSVSVMVVVCLVWLWLDMWLVSFVVSVLVVLISLNRLMVVLLQVYGGCVSRNVSGVQKIVNMVKLQVFSSVCWCSIGFCMNSLLMECSNVKQFRLVLWWKCGRLCCNVSVVSIRVVVVIVYIRCQLFRLESRLVMVCVSRMFSSRLFINVLIMWLWCFGVVSVVVNGISIWVIIENRLVIVVFISSQVSDGVQVLIISLFVDSRFIIMIRWWCLNRLFSGISRIKLVVQFSCVVVIIMLIWLNGMLKVLVMVCSSGCVQQLLVMVMLVVIDISSICQCCRGGRDGFM